MPSASRLERVSVDRPCSKRWSELAGDDRRRFCGDCGLHVTNLSALGRGEAEAFLARGSGRVCVTYLPAAGGGAASREELERVRRTGALLGGVRRAAGWLLGLAFLLPGCRPAQMGAPGELAAPGPGPQGDPADCGAGRIVGRISAQPRCSVEDQGFVMGEMSLPEPPASAPDGAGQPDGERP